MQIHKETFSGIEPNVSECRTRKVLKDLSECLCHNATCIYSFSDCCTSTYCLYPDPDRFLAASKPSIRLESTVH